MKTFLHYSKERELDEGIVTETLAGLAGSFTRGLAKAGEIADVSRQAFSGYNAGAKPGDAWRGKAAAAGSIVDKAERSREGQENLDNMLIDAEDDLKNYRRKHSKAKTPEDKQYYQDKIDETEEKLRRLSKVKKPSDLKNISRAASSSASAKIRSSYP